MVRKVLVLQVRLHDGRYHGAGDWPPSPARLFQALVAGVGLSGPVGQPERQALEWLERQGPPSIGAPAEERAERPLRLYLPNNDGNRIGGDPKCLPKIRTATKSFQPYFFDPTIPFVYAWVYEDSSGAEAHALTVCNMAERLYQFGRGIDLAWAWGAVLEEAAFEEFLATFPGVIYHASPGSNGTTLLCPYAGSLSSILKRHEEVKTRFQKHNVFRQPSRPRFQPVAYNAPPARKLYELQHPFRREAFAAWPLEGASTLVVRLRDAAVRRLKDAIPDAAVNIDRALVGRKRDGSNACPPEHRVRIIPLPSVGHVHADRQIRRVLIEVPPACPLRADDVFWSFSLLDLVDEESGEVQAVLCASEGDTFLNHFSVGEARYRTWRTVTPAALPELSRRRRIEPSKKQLEAKSGSERFDEQRRAAAAVLQALRHAAVQVPIESILVQREPFEAQGARVEAFASGTRFPKERLWHVQVVFRPPVAGPLVLGDGRFLGLGVMVPLKESPQRG